MLYINNNNDNDKSYIDFEVMKKYIEKTNKDTKINKIELIEEVKKKYNEKIDDIMDKYIYITLKKKTIINHCKKDAVTVIRRNVKKIKKLMSPKKNAKESL